MERLYKQRLIVGKFYVVLLLLSQGITGLSLSREVVDVLGNMVCTLDKSYIENSDPHILEKLKGCKDLSNSQVAAVESLLLSGKTIYGYEGLLIQKYIIHHLFNA